jgi:hypothetical protein
MSVGRDRYFQFHCKENGRRLGGYLCNAWCTAVEYDEEARWADIKLVLDEIIVHVKLPFIPCSRYAFIGDYSGQVIVCRLEESGVTLINTLKGHNGSIQSITWDGSKGWLYTGKCFLLRISTSLPPWKYTP